MALVAVPPVGKRYVEGPPACIALTAVLVLLSLLSISPRTVLSFVWVVPAG